MGHNYQCLFHTSQEMQPVTVCQTLDVSHREVTKDEGLLFSYNMERLRQECPDS